MFKSKSDIFKHFEFIFAIVSLLQLSQAIIPLFLTGGANEGNGIDVIGLDLSVHAKISILVYLVVFVLLAMRWKRSLAAFSSNILVLILLGIVCFSSFWTINPDQTIRFSIYAIATTGIGLYLATRYTLVEQMQLLTWTYGLLLVLSILFGVVIPEYGIIILLFSYSQKPKICHC
ncbi:MAG TPA: hypothetical protein V6C71_04675 [Coleofasciculaceae cyanobacterium]|jgi:hypothetical protein